MPDACKKIGSIEHLGCGADLVPSQSVNQTYEPVRQEMDQHPDHGPRQLQPIFLFVRPELCPSNPTGTTG